MNKPDNQAVVIFGASGDLTKRKLIPAIFDLEKQKLLPDGFAVIGVGRTELTDESFQEKMNKAIYEFADGNNEDKKVVDQFIKKLHYVSIDTQSAEDYETLKNKLSVIDNSLNINGNYIFYLATPPKIYETVAQNLGHQKLNIQTNGYGTKRLIVEKPFGYDLKSAQTLNKKLMKIFKEDQIYRIDHYLGKETVQNLLVTRFSNGIFEPLWNRNYVHHVEITAAENIGVENRGGYYDGSGALRDMVQNHLLQVTGLVAMEPPSSFNSNSIRNEIVKVFHSLRPIKSG